MSDQLSHGILLRPLLGAVVVLGLVCLVEPRDLRDERVVRVGVT